MSGARANTRKQGEVKEIWIELNHSIYPSLEYTREINFFFSQVPFSRGKEIEKIYRTSKKLENFENFFLGTYKLYAIIHCFSDCKLIPVQNEKKTNEIAVKKFFGIKKNMLTRFRIHRFFFLGSLKVVVW